MRPPRPIAFVAFAVLSLFGPACASNDEKVDAQAYAVGTRQQLPETIAISPAPELRFPGPTDSNSPAHWDGDTLYLFNSEGEAHRSSGSDLAGLGGTTTVHFEDIVNGYRWIEGTWKDDDGTLYGWYHNEPFGLCPGNTLTAPKIGAARSHDNGASWENLGIILDSPHALRCDAANTFFAGGIGDPSVIRHGEYIYFYVSTYAGDRSEQGVAVARMRYSDRDAPVDKVWKWREGAWNEPGRSGHVTPIFVARKGWTAPDLDAFWGPAISYNSHLNRFVILMNRSVAGDWSQKGVYASFNADAGDPNGWSAPVDIHDPSDSELYPFAWYPQVFGTNTKDRETDKLVGQTARFFLRGRSTWQATFVRPDEAAACSGGVGNLHGVVNVDGKPRIGMTVSAWGHAAGDFHVTTTNAFGFYAFEGLQPGSAYNVVANARFEGDGLVDIDPAMTSAARDNLELRPGTDCWTREDIGLATR